jgi:peptidyl-prolyl cis-trans isomerase C
VTKKLVLTVLFLLLLSAPTFAGDSTILAKVNGKEITLSDFNRIVSHYDAEKRKTLEENPQFKATILRRIVQGMVVSKIARDNGFDKRPDIKEQLELLSNDFLSTAYLAESVIGEVNVTEDDMRLYYKAHEDDFKTPEMVRVRDILIRVGKSASDEMKKKAEDKAEDILKRIKSGEDFAKLASEFSDDQHSRKKGGEIGFITKDRVTPDLGKVAFSLKVGEVSPVFETSFGFHILKVEERKEAVLEPFEKVEGKVRERVTEDFKRAKASAFLEKAMKEAGVEINVKPFMPKK